MSEGQDSVLERITRSLALASQRRDALFKEWTNWPENRSPASSPSVVPSAKPLLSTTATMGTSDHLFKGHDVSSNENKVGECIYSLELFEIG